MADYDLIIHAGRVFCADTGRDGPGAVAVSGDRIVASGPDVDGSATQTLSYPDALLLPGLVDLHAHPGLPETRYGVDPDKEFLPRGVTTVMSQGDAGALDLKTYQEQIIEASKTRVLLAINLSKDGERNPNATLETIEDADVDACVSAIEMGGNDIWGIAFNTGPFYPVDPWEVMQRGLEAADQSGKPILFGSSMVEDWPLADQLEILRPGDVLTYCFNNRPQNLLENGRVKQAVREAREKGVLFDVGHGMASFTFEISEPCIAQDFWPDTISSDQYRRHVGSKPQHDLPRTFSKLIAAGMPETEAFARATIRPAEILGLAGEIGTLAPGACADLAVLQFNESAMPLVDVHDIERPGGCWEAIAVIRAGERIV